MPTEPAGNSGRGTVTITVALPLDYAYARDALRGVTRYRPRSGPWSLRHGTLPKGGVPEYLRVVPVSGMILMLSDPVSMKLAKATAVPVVNISGRWHEVLLPTVLPDNHMVGRLAAKHLLERGFRRFCYIGQKEGFSRTRREGFAAEIASAGCTCSVGSNEQTSELIESIRSLDPPVGIMVESDSSAVKVAREITALGFRMPEQFALIGVDNDELLCATVTPQLSSVDPGAERVGYEAAVVLDSILCGDAPPPNPLLVAPRGVVTRESTDIIAVEDPDLASALQFIRAHACGSLCVDDVVDATGVGRRTLEVRFFKHFGRTLHDEIRRVRMQRAAQLLVDTDMKVEQVALRCGFGDFRRFIGDFGREFGRPPGKYRRQFRLT